MKKHLRKISFSRFLLLWFPCLAMLTLILVACPPPTNVSRSLSGTVRDSVTGAGVSGITVDFASHTATTDSNGSFSIDLGNQGGTISGGLSTHGTGYIGKYFTPVSLDVSKDTQVVLYVTPLSTASYPTHSVKIVIKDKSSVEIAAGTAVDFYVLSSADGCASWTNGMTTVQYVSGGNTFASPVFGNDCLVAATVYGTSWPVTTFNVMKKEDLSASSTTVTLTQDSGANTTDVVVTGDAKDNRFQLALCCPYGMFGAGGATFSDALATETLKVTNPYGYAGFWAQTQMIPNYLGSGYTKMFVSSSNEAAIGTSVTLPGINSSLGPDSIPDTNSIAYSSGTLSITPVTSANGYVFFLHDNTDNTDFWVMPRSASVGLPSWLTSQLAGDSVDIGLYVTDTDVAWDLSLAVAMTRTVGGNPPMPLKAGVLAGFPTKNLTF